MKLCKACKTEKQLEDFYKHPTGYLGRAGKCKQCYLQYQTQYYEHNKENRKEYQRDWNKQNKDYYNLRKAQRRARTKTDNLSPEEKKIIRGVYRLARLYTWITGEPWHVDHIVPLNGKMVSGLHVPANLQVVPASYNQRKGNRHD
jgi:hypothetical protein